MRNQLLERHREALRRMIGLRMDPVLQRRVDASDIVQDVLIDAHRRLAEYLQATGMPFHLWLRHLARDRLIDAHRGTGSPLGEVSIASSRWPASTAKTYRRWIGRVGARSTIDAGRGRGAS